MSEFNYISFIDEKCPGAKPLYVVIRGSHAYGTNIETSDKDFAGVYIQSLDNILGSSYIPQISDEKNDTVFYEIKRFLELIGVNNPTILELLNTPDDCILYKDPIFDSVIQHKNDYITKICAKSFGGYAISQIRKAKGMDKKQNWESERMERKTPIDFCYRLLGNDSVPLSRFLKEKKINQSRCGLSKIPHSKDMYSLFYDSEGKHGMRGICFENSNEIRLSSIPKELVGNSLIGYISYNKDGYTQHCNDYKSYQTWLENRNTQRYVDVKSHGQKIDGKNMMHCRRLLEMAKEIAEGNGVLVKRPNAEYLLSIRSGNVDLQSLIDKANYDIEIIDKLFNESNLPDSVDQNLLEKILVNIRKSFYFNK